MRAQPVAVGMQWFSQGVQVNMQSQPGAGENGDVHTGLGSMPADASGQEGMGIQLCPWPTAVLPMTTRWW